jgi:phosphoribosylformimino-5-aminoimidazole carboxamide ribonucleotide (ProFAR) isomerase
MKKIIILLLLFNSYCIVAQKEMITSNGVINFEASVPLFEEVKATNVNVQCILNTKTGKIFCNAFIKDFNFKIALMEKHYNEYYLESDRYPKATFKGRIEGFNINIIGNSPKKFNIKGKLKLHGVIKDISSLVFLKKINGKLEIITNFSVYLKDFNIKIPKVLSMKIAEKANIKTSFILK